MNDLVIAKNQVRYEQKAYWRNPMAAVFTLMFPVDFLVVVGTMTVTAVINGIYFPIHHMITALVSAFEGGPGSGLRVHDLVVMLIWAAAALAFTAKRFRWEPKHR